jgi:hypothetical protein
MRKLLISWIESILLYMDRVDNKQPKLKNLTTYLAVGLVLFREKIDPYEIPIDFTRKDDDLYRETLGQVELMENPGGGYGLLYYGRGEAAHYIEKRGGQGGGYSWEALVRVILELRNCQTQSLTFDPEADMFAVYSPDIELLRVLAGIINELIEDQELMEKAISLALERGMFE